MLNKLVQKKNLTTEEASSLLNKVMKGNISLVILSAIFVAMRTKGETIDEILGFIQAMRQNMVPVNINNAIDVCGTGGDASNSFNISTAVAFVLAGAGVKVAKHGNRAASSRCGSADVLEELGINIQMTPEQAEKVFEKTGIVFLFAPLFHPTLKNISTLRKELKIRTIFNFLGPFANPASVKKQLIGVPNKEIAEKLAEVGSRLKYEHLLIVTSKDGLDEISLSSDTFLYEVKNTKIKKSVVSPTDFGFKKTSQTEFSGGGVKENAMYIKNIMQGVRGPRRDIVILNSVFALYVAGIAKNIKQGILLSEESIDSGMANSVLRNLRKETQNYE